MNDAEQLKHNRLVTVATLHYLHGRTHAQIAAQLGLSRVKVTRLLKEAVNGRIVEFRIADPVAATVDLSLGLEKRFGLKRAIVVPGDGQIDRLGREAASLMMSLLAPGLQKVWGTHASRVVADPVGVYPIPDRVPDDEASLFTVWAVGLHGVNITDAEAVRAWLADRELPGFSVAAQSTQSGAVIDLAVELAAPRALTGRPEGRQPPAGGIL